MSERRVGLSSVNPVVEWIWRLGWSNLLWIGLTLAGGVVVGFFPATAALYATWRRWLRTPQSREEPIARLMLAAWKQELGRANAIGWPVAFLTAVLSYDLWLTGQLAGAGRVAFYASVVIAGLLLAMLLHLPFVLAHVEGPPLRLVRTAAMLALAFPLHTVAIAAVIVGLSFVETPLPALLVFASASPVAACTAYLDLRGFARLEQQRAAELES